MSVKLRKKKGTTGKTSLYLDIYHNGARHYEFLKLYLHKVTTPLDRVTNKETLQLAESIRSKKELEFNNTQHGFTAKFKSNASFLEYFERLTKEKNKGSIGTNSTWKAALVHIKEYHKSPVLTFGEISEQWLENLKAYLLSKLSQNGASQYFNKVGTALKQAKKDKIIGVNPFESVGKIKTKETKRQFLTAEELQLLAASESKPAYIKASFLFSALTGLRISDIESLKWGNIKHSKQLGYFLEYKQKKTSSIEVLPISKQARELLGEAGNDTAKVFPRLIRSTWFTKKVTDWVTAAGIKKPITFHCARHTHATLLLSSGVDIYTVSKMLGHKDINTTQIYAKIIDQKKVDAVNSLPILNF